MRMVLTAVLLLLVLQMPSVALQPQGSGRSSLEGVVVRAGIGEPLAEARVTLSISAPASLAAGGVGALVTSVSAVPAGASMIAVSPAAPPDAATAIPAIPPVTTDSNGRFAFQNLDAGLYRLQVLRNGYARQSVNLSFVSSPFFAEKFCVMQQVSCA